MQSQCSLQASACAHCWGDVSNSAKCSWQDMVQAATRVDWIALKRGNVRQIRSCACSLILSRRLPLPWKLSIVDFGVLQPVLAGYRLEGCRWRAGSRNQLQGYYLERRWPERKRALAGKPLAHIKQKLAMVAFHSVRGMCMHHFHRCSAGSLCCWSGLRSVKQAFCCMALHPPCGSHQLIHASALLSVHSGRRLTIPTFYNMHAYHAMIHGSVAAGSWRQLRRLTFCGGCRSLNCACIAAMPLL